MPRRMTAWLLFAAPCWGAWAADQNPAVALIELGTVAMRTDPDASKQAAEQALDIIRRHPDADLEIRARLLLCDYYSERDGSAAREQIDAANALLPQAQRKGLRAGVLTCRGETQETAGDNAHAMTDFDEAVGVAAAAEQHTMPAEGPVSRGAFQAPLGANAASVCCKQASAELVSR